MGDPNDSGDHLRAASSSSFSVASPRDSVELSREIRESFREDIAVARAKEDELALQLADLDAAVSRLKRLDSGAHRSMSLTIIQPDMASENLLTSTPKYDRKASCVQGTHESSAYLDFLAKNGRSLLGSVHGEDEDGERENPSRTNSQSQPSTSSLQKSGAHTAHGLTTSEAEVASEAVSASQDRRSTASRTDDEKVTEQPIALRSPPSLVGDGDSARLATALHDDGDGDVFVSPKESPGKRRGRFIRVETLPAETPSRRPDFSSDVADGSWSGGYARTRQLLMKESEEMSRVPVDLITDQPAAVRVLSPINDHGSPKSVKVKVHSRITTDPAECSPILRMQHADASRRHSSPGSSSRAKEQAIKRPYRLTAL